MPFIETRDGTRLFYKSWGQGQPAVLVHGWGLSADAWSAQMIDHAGRGVLCVAYDRRGHGRSDDPGRGFDYDTLAGDLNALIERLDLREVTLVSHSMGGGEVVRYLTRYGSDRVARIVLVAPSTPFLLKTDDNPDGVDGAVFEYLRAQLSGDYPKWLADNAAPFFVPETSLELMDWVLGIRCNRR